MLTQFCISFTEIKYSTFDVNKDEIIEVPKNTIKLAKSPAN
jgi:hypothetical protein